MADPKIVFFDLEIIPNLPMALRYWPQLSTYEGRTLRATVTSTVCFGYSIFGSKKMDCVSTWDFKNKWLEDVNDDKSLCEAAYEILKDADAVVTHNGKRFDWKYLQTRLQTNKLPLLPKIHHIDTKAIASSNLFYFSNSLDHLTENLGLTRKLSHDGWPLWEKTHGSVPRVRCEKSESLMTKYCKQDVKALTELYKEMRPLVANIPNFNLYQVGGSKPVCPSCGSTRLISEGIRSTTTRIYRRYNCKDCGSWSRTDVSDKNPRPA